jgi:adsorption protein B
VLPLREEGDVLVIASESNINPVSLAAIGRKVARKVRFVIAPKGQVTVGVRHWYARHATPPSRTILDDFVNKVSNQSLLGELLLSLGYLDAEALKASLLRHEKSSMSLGEFLVKQGVIKEAMLQEALTLQKQFQTAIPTMLADIDTFTLPHAELSKLNNI